MGNNERKNLFSLVFLAFIALLIPLTVLVAKQSQEIRKKATGTAIVLNPNSATKTLNTVFPVNVLLTGSPQIVYAKVKLTFNKTILNVASEIQIPSGFNTERKTSVADANSSGVIEFILTVPGGTVEPSGNVSLATINFKGISAGTGTVNFDQSGIQIVSKDEQVVGVSPSGATFTISGGSGPTATPTQGATEGNLSFDPQTTTKPVNQTFNSVVKINTGSIQIVYAKVKLTFNKTILNVASEIQIPSGFNTERKTSVADANSSGVIEFILTVPGSGAEPSGSINLATIPFKGIANGTANLSFDLGNVQIVAKDEHPLSVSGSSANYTIGTAVPTPTPTGGTRPTPTPTGGVRPTPTPTRRVGPTATPIPPPVCRAQGETCTYVCRQGEECILPSDLRGICCPGLTCSGGVCVPAPSITGPVTQTLLKLKVKINGLTAEPARVEDRKQPFKVTLGYNYEGGPSRTYEASLQHEINGIFSNVIDISDFFNPPPIYSEGMGGGGPYTPTYKLFVKWAKSLQKKYTVALIPGTTNVVELTARTRDYLDACDLPDPNNNYEQDGMCNSVDYTLVASNVGKTDADSLRVADLNLDGAINGIDLNILVNAIFTRYEDEIQ